MSEMKLTIIFNNSASAYRILDKIEMLSGVVEVMVDAITKKEENEI